MQRNYLFSIIFNGKMEMSPEVNLMMMWQEPSFLEMSDEASDRNVIYNQNTVDYHIIFAELGDQLNMSENFYHYAFKFRPCKNQ